MPQSIPQVSVLMSVRNGMPYVKETIPSILGQTFPDFEFVIVDNASTDGTRQYLQEITSLTGRVRLVLNERDLGHSGGLNRGLQECRAEWIARVDADDIALPHRLERQLAFVAAHPEIGVTCCLAYYINAQGHRKGKTSLDLTTVEKFRDYMARGEAIGLLHPGVLMRRSAVVEAGGYREQFAGANDIDLWNRISERNHLILVQPEYLMEYRVHAASISSAKFLDSRLKYEWVRACMAARRSGRPEPDWETFLRDWRNVGIGKRLNRTRKTLAKMYYRLAGENFIAGRHFKGARFFLLSALLQPDYAVRRLTSQLLLKKRTESDLPPAVPGKSAQRPQAPVTVIIACRNAAPFVGQAVDSCLRQTRPPEEIVVIDDASDDGSSAILDELARQGVIRLIRNATGQGRGASVNPVLNSAKTRYVALLDADDLAIPTRLERQVAFMDAHPRLGCSSSFVHYINTQGEKIANGVLNLLNEQTFNQYLTGDEPFGLFCPAVILRTEALANPALRFRPQFWPADDIDLWNRIAEAGWQVLAQPEFLTEYRIHSQSAVTTRAHYTRLQFEWVRACLRARRQGQPEPTQEDFESNLARAPWYSRLNRTRKIKAKAACRAAGFALGERQYLKAAITLLRAFCLQPGYVARRVTQQFFP